MSPEVENGTVARCLPTGSEQERPARCPVESISDIYNIQRLKVSTTEPFSIYVGPHHLSATSPCLPPFDDDVFVREF